MSNEPKAQRTTTVKTFTVVQPSGAKSYYRATSKTQANTFHNKLLEVRKATDDELMDIGSRDLAVGGIPRDPAPVNDRQIDAFLAPGE